MNTKFTYQFTLCNILNAHDPDTIKNEELRIKNALQGEAPSTLNFRIKPTTKTILKFSALVFIDAKRCIDEVTDTQGILPGSTTQALMP